MFKTTTFVVSLMPLAYSVLQVYLLQTGGDHQLGADPGKELVLIQGEWTLRFLLFTLLVTPVRKLFKWNRIQTIRRMLGLFTFFYASLHLLGYTVLLLELDFDNVLNDVAKRPYITVGFAAYLLLIPLAVTSNSWMIRRLRQRWALLHRAVYGVAVLAIVHLTWLSKSSYFEAVIFGTIVFLLLVFRLLDGRGLAPGKLSKSTS